MLKKLLSVFRRFGRVLFISVLRYGKDRHSDRAVTLTYYTLFAIVPVAAMLFGIAKGFDLEIIDKLTTSSAKSHLARVAMEGLKRVLKRRAFTSDAIVEKTLNDYVVTNNTVLLFIREENPKLNNESVQDIFTQYQVFCSMNNVKPVSKINFSKQIVLNCKVRSVVKSIRGKSTRVFETIT